MSETEPRATERPWPRVSRLRVAGPVVLIVAALVAAGISATVRENSTNATSSTASTSTAGTHPAARSSVPITYAVAAKEGKVADYDWGPECDHRTGRLKVPTVYAPPCVPVPTGANGGDRERGHGHDDQRRLLPGPAGRAGLGHLECGRHQRPGPRHRAGLRGHVQPGLRALRAPREPHPLHRIGGRRRSGGGPRRRRHRRAAAARLRLHQRAR